MLVKICGITRLEDAECAVECGADALGFVFWPPSPRFVDPARAKPIVAALPPFVTAVGVFVNQPRDHVNRIAAEVRLGAIQLHGEETIEYAASIDYPVLKAIRLAEPAAAVDQWPRRTVILVDSDDPVRRGGTGRPVDWTRAAQIAARRPVLLAGGITPENVGEAVSRVQPFGIDVSSGVEASAGVKDGARIKALFEAVSGIDSWRRTSWIRR